jgi:hypothetical protein
MSAQRINRAIGIGMVVLSLLALLTVLIGYTRPPLPPPPGRTEPDEGALAHIFQLTIVLLVPVILLFLATADWTQPARSARPLAIAVPALVLAFAALYYLEHFFYPAHFH